MRREVLVWLLLCLCVESCVAAPNTRYVSTNSTTLDFERNNQLREKALHGIVNFIHVSTTLMDHFSPETHTKLSEITLKLPIVQKLLASTSNKHKFLLENQQVLLSLTTQLFGSDFHSKVAEMLRGVTAMNPLIPGMMDCKNGVVKNEAGVYQCVCNPGYEGGGTADSVTPCTACPAGKFNPTAGGTCEACNTCPAHVIDTVCTATTDSVCGACATGFYLANDECTACRPDCQAGEFEVVSCGGTTDRVCSGCPPADYAQHTAECGVCHWCEPGTQLTTHCSATASTVCSPCPSGTTSKGGLQSCQPCTACTLNRPEKNACTASADTVCADCPVGRYSNTANGACFLCSICPSGSYPETGCTTASNTECAKCPIGKTSRLGDSVCSACAPGKFANREGSTTCSNCRQCPPGNYAATVCSATTDADCQLCEPGTYSEVANQPLCAICPEGTFASRSGSTSCKDCKTCNPGEMMTTACTATTDAVCENCPAGTYAPDGLGSQCFPCPAGTFAGLAGLEQCSQCSECPPGTRMDQACTPRSDTRCVPCDTNTFSLTKDSQTCLACSGACESNEYLVEPCSPTQDRLCAPCGENTYTVEGGACRKCSECRAGTFLVTKCHDNLDTVCTPCTIGTFTNDINLSACVPYTVCPAGTKIDPANPGSASADRKCLDCEAGKFSTESDSVTCRTCTDCAAGKYISGGCSDLRSERTCADCASGFFTNAPNQPTCEPCGDCPSGQAEGACVVNQGRVCGDVNCANGAKSTDGSSCNCNAGYHGGGFWNDDSNAYPSCQACPSGKYSTGGSAVCAAWTTCTAPKVAIGGSTVADVTCEDCSHVYDATARTCTSCSSTEYLKDNTCVACSTCPDGKFVNAACSATADTVCVAAVCPFGVPNGNKCICINGGTTNFENGSYQPCPKTWAASLALAMLGEILTLPMAVISFALVRKLWSDNTGKPSKWIYLALGVVALLAFVFCIVAHAGVLTNVFGLLGGVLAIILMIPFGIFVWKVKGLLFVKSGTPPKVLQSQSSTTVQQTKPKPKPTRETKSFELQYGVFVPFYVSDQPTWTPIKVAQWPPKPSELTLRQAQVNDFIAAWATACPATVSKLPTSDASRKTCNAFEELFAVYLNKLFEWKDGGSDVTELTVSYYTQKPTGACAQIENTHQGSHHKTTRFPSVVSKPAATLPKATIVLQKPTIAGVVPDWLLTPDFVVQEPCLYPTMKCTKTTTTTTVTTTQVGCIMVMKTSPATEPEVSNKGRVDFEYESS